MKSCTLHDVSAAQLSLQVSSEDWKALREHRLPQLSELVTARERPDMERLQRGQECEAEAVYAVGLF